MKIKNLVILFLVLTVGCAWIKKEPTDSQNFYEAQNVLNEMFKNYRNYMPGYLAPYVSNDFTPNKYEYISNVSKAASDEHVLKFNAVTYKINRVDDIMNVKFRWTKKRNKYSSVHIDSIAGDSEFVFKNFKKQWLLISVSGDNPFVN